MLPFYNIDLSPRWDINLISISLSAPSRVPLFQVSSIAATHVTLLWKDVPPCEQYGVILYYQIGVAGQKGTYQQYMIQLL